MHFSFNYGYEANTQNLLFGCWGLVEGGSASRPETFFSQSNLSDSFVNFVDFVIVDKTHYEKWVAVESVKNSRSEKKKKKN